ncbi:unnamed protein product [Strongylus vulgaris]|uniref:Uncharacterized protein n=1 Tax=Strongylus vulgaris TaxID=40348 RepID=A0A3P7IJ67_STRVU|nr:unnamed protein product [Strongylus vulgaris]
MRMCAAFVKLLNHANRRQRNTEETDSSSKRLKLSLSAPDDVCNGTATGYICPLCEKSRPDEEMRDSWRNRQQNPILLSCLLIENSIGVKKARKVYLETLLRKKRLCKAHYTHAGILIGNAIKQATGKFPILGLDCVSAEVWHSYFVKIVAFGAMIDKELVIQLSDVINFFADCLVMFHYSGDWETLIESNDSESQLNLSTVALTPALWEDKTTTESFEVPNDSSNFPSEVILADSSGICEPSREEMEKSGDEELCYSHKMPTQKSWNCGICNMRCSESDLSASSRNDVLMILSCFVINELMDTQLAKNAYLRITSGKNVMICKGHYVQAAATIEKEMKRFLQAHSPERTDLSTLPRSIWSDLVIRIQAYGFGIDNWIFLKGNHLEKFYYNCLSISLLKSATKSQLKQESEDCNLLFCDATTEPISTASLKECSANNNADKLENIGYQEDNHSRNRSCNLCGLIRDEDESRVGSTNPRQNLILISSLVASGITDAESGKDIFKRVLCKRKRICKQHYVEAARWIGEQVEKNWGRFPIHGLFGIPREMLSAVLERIQEYVKTFSEEEDLTAEELARFYGDCLAKYRHMNGWKDRAVQSKKETVEASYVALQNLLCETKSTESPSKISIIFPNSCHILR